MSTKADHTIEYYDTNAAEYAATTVDAPMAGTVSRFTELLPKEGKVLDFGCGSGRDTKYFLEHGFKVDALDGSAELAKLASEYTGIEVKTVLFQDFDETDRYDGIWACACLLHLNENDLKDVLGRLHQALKNGGVLYVSFKYGDYQGNRAGRYYNYMNEKGFSAILEDINGLKIIKTWLGEDSLGRENADRWFNILMRKTAK